MLLSIPVFLIGILLHRIQLHAEPIDNAYRTLAEARGKKVKLFAPGPFAAAEGSFASMLAEWRNQNKRFFLLRDYRHTIELALMTDSLSRRSELSATDLEDSLNSLVPVFGNRLRSKIEMFNKTFSGLPMTTEQREEFTRSELFFAEGNDAFERNDLLDARNQFDSAGKYIDTVSFVIRNSIIAYLEKFPEWNVWTEQTIRWSKQHCQTAIIVDKMAHSLSLFYNGKEGIRIPVEFGPNWIGVKAHRGDCATPEGQYFIRRKTAFSTFGKALEIDYPNAEDRKGAVNADGIYSQPDLSALGGDIEIHGGGGRQCNWTDGCMALTDKNIETIYSQVSVGTPVTIVGTTSKAIADSFHSLQ